MRDSVWNAVTQYAPGTPGAFGFRPFYVKRRDDRHAFMYLPSFSAGFYISCLPSRARDRVTSSAYSSWLPTGTP